MHVRALNAAAVVTATLTLNNLLLLHCVCFLRSSRLVLLIRDGYC